MLSSRGKIAKIGWLGEGGSGVGRKSVLRELRNLGYIEGKNIAIEYRYADGKLDRLPALADELIRLKVDVLITQSTSAALARTVAVFGRNRWPVWIGRRSQEKLKLKGHAG